MGSIRTQNVSGHRGFTFGEFVLDIDRAALTCNGDDAKLRPQSFDVLCYLVKHHGRLVTRHELLTEIWGDTAVTDDSLTHCIIDIRKVLGDHDHRMVRTVPRRGFVFEMPVIALAGAAKATTSNRPPGWRRPAAFVATATALVAVFVLADTQPENTPAAAIAPVQTAAEGRYLQGRFLFQRRAEGDLEAARNYFLEVISLQPDHARAWAGLAGVYATRVSAIGEDNIEDAVRLKEAAEKAVSLDPNLAEGWARLASYYCISDDRPTCERYFQRAIDADPDDPLVLGMRAGWAAGRGDLVNAIEMQRRAVMLEPLSVVNRGNLAYYLFAAGNYEEAMIENERAHHMRPDFAGAADTLIGFSLIKMERFEEALRVIAAWPDGPDKFAGLAMANHALGNYAEAKQAAARLTAGSDAHTIFRIAELAAYCVDIERSFAHLVRLRDRLVSQSDGDLSDWLNMIHFSPFLRDVRADPRWHAWVGQTT